LKPSFNLRAATPDDALCLGVLATQVFLDTYATQGIRAVIANEVLTSFSTTAMRTLIEAAHSPVLLAESNAHLIGFAQYTLGTPQTLVRSERPAELDKLYVQEPFTRCGVGTALLCEVEAAVAQLGADTLWLSPWVHNQRALQFYARQGYQNLGNTLFMMEGEAVENFVLAKTLQRP
jgi:diamine N-acetyltransferase